MRRPFYAHAALSWFGLPKTDRLEGGSSHEHTWQIVRRCHDSGRGCAQCIGCAGTASNVGVAQVPSSQPTAAPTPTPAPSATPAPTPTTSPSPKVAVLTGGEPSALKPGRYAIASLHNGVPAQLATSYPRMYFTVPAGWSGNANVVGKTFVDGGPSHDSCSLGSSIMGSRTLALTTPPSCRKPDPGRPVSSASSPVSQDSTRGRSTGPPQPGSRT